MKFTTSALLIGATAAANTPAKLTTFPAFTTVTPLASGDKDGSAVKSSTYLGANGPYICLRNKFFAVMPQKTAGDVTLAKDKP